MTENTVKPLVFTAWDEAGMSDIINMAEAIAGGAARLKLNPFLLCYLEPTTPLQHTEVVLRKVLMMADHGLPFVYAPGPIEGAAAPVTSAGALAMANAEVLSGLVITQLRRKGTPFVWGSGSGPLDMRTMVGTYGAPEFMLHCMGMAELAHYYYHLPVWGFSGYSDSKLPDMQAGIESALWILWTALSGANLVHDIGYIESGLTCSYEMIVVCNEIVGFVRRLIGGIELSPEVFFHEYARCGDFLVVKHRGDFDTCWSTLTLEAPSKQRSITNRTRAAVGTHLIWSFHGHPPALQHLRHPRHHPHRWRHEHRSIRVI